MADYLLGFKTPKAKTLEQTIIKIEERVEKRTKLTEYNTYEYSPNDYKKQYPDQYAYVDFSEEKKRRSLLENEVTQIINALPAHDLLSPEDCKEILTLLVDRFKIKKSGDFGELALELYGPEFHYTHRMYARCEGWKPWSVEAGKNFILKTNDILQTKVVGYLKKIDGRLTAEMLDTLGAGKSSSPGCNGFSEKVATAALSYEDTPPAALMQIINHKRTLLGKIMGGPTQTRLAYDKSKLASDQSKQEQKKSDAGFNSLL